MPVKNRSFVCKVPHGLDPAAACLVPCSGITAYHAVLNARPAIERSTKYNGKSNSFASNSCHSQLYTKITCQHQQSADTEYSKCLLLKDAVYCILILRTVVNEVCTTRMDCLPLCR
jgi:hypothetical protein